MKNIGAVEEQDYNRSRMEMKYFIVYCVCCNIFQYMLDLIQVLFKALAGPIYGCKRSWMFVNIPKEITCFWVDLKIKMSSILIMWMPFL